MGKDSTPNSPDNTPAHDPYELFRLRNFRLYVIGRLVAVVGQQMFAMAIGWELYERTGSAMALALVGLTQVVPMFLFTLPAGHFADNHNRKHIIIVTTFIVALANAGLAAISWTSAPVWITYVCLFVTASARTFLAAGAASFLPQLVERRLLSQAINWNASVFQSASIAGPLLAGVVIAQLGHAAPVFAFNALAALLFCVLLLMIEYRYSPPAVRDPFTLSGLLNGFRFVFDTRIVLGTITLDMFAVLLGGVTALLPIFAKDILFVGPRGLGLLQAAQPLGAIACSLYMAHRPPLQKAGRSLILAVIGFGAATIVFGLSHWFWLSALMLFTCGAVDNISVVVRHTLVQLMTPDEKRGRVSAVNNLFIGTSNELGEFESGAVTQLLQRKFGMTIAASAAGSAVIGGVGTILVVLAVAWYWPEIRKYGRLDGHA